MKRTTSFTFILFFLIKCAYAHDPASEMAFAAARFLESLDLHSKKKTLHAFDSKERENWHFFPGSFLGSGGRKVLALGEMSAAQKILAHALLGSALSHRGLLEASEIILLEQILYDRSGNDIRNVGHYHISIFGQPDKTGTWGWRFEGHHLSLNFSFINGRIFSVTPSFFGAGPAKVSDGRHMGMRVLAAEEEKARKLVRSLNSPQRKMALVSEKPPREILSGQDSLLDRKSFFPPQGLPITKMNPRQVGWLKEVIIAYSSKHRPKIINQVSNRKPLLHPEETYFVWAGSLQKDEPHYYRIQTPDFLFEYANVQNDANHIHGVWRDFNGDFGRDLLAEHYHENHQPVGGWVSMFDGKTLEGWKANEDQDSFWVKNGCIVANARNRCHLFYQSDKPFKNFEFKARVLTLPQSNAGIYFHTRFQDEGWPKVGFECQVNNTYHDPKKTASLYGVVDCLDAPANDDEWFDIYIKVDGRRVITKVNQNTVVDWTQPIDWKRGQNFERILNEGTFALQGHDSESTVLFRDLMVKRLP